MTSITTMNAITLDGVTWVGCLARGKRMRWFGRRKSNADGTPAIASTSMMGASDIFYDVAMRRLDEQISRSDAYSAKVASAFSVGTTVLPITFGLLQLQNQTIPKCALVLLYAAVAAFILLMIFSLLVLVPGSLDCRPSLTDLDTHSRTESDLKIKRWVARECVTSVTDNDKKLSRRALMLTAAIVFLALETTFLSIAVLIVLS